MPQVGIRELKNETSAIIRTVREEQEAYIVTHRGKPVAMILPIDEAIRSRSDAQVLAQSREQAAYWERLDALAAELDAAWGSDKSAVELVAEQRRDFE